MLVSLERLYMHLTERGNVAKPLNINTNGVNKKINIILCVSTFAKPECDNVLQPDPRISERCSTLLGLCKRM